MFEKLITSLDALPADKREDEYLEELRAADAAARTSHAKILSLRAELKSEVSHRKTLFDAARKSAMCAGVGAVLKTNRQPAKILATGLDLAAPKTVCLSAPDAPTNFRGAPTDNEGEAQLRWKRSIRRCWA